MAFSFFKKKQKKEEVQTSKAASPYYNLQIKQIINETKDAVSIVFEQPQNRIEYKSGQFLTLITDIDGKEVRRAYSLCTSPFVDEDLAVTVKRVEGGLMSNWLPDNLKAGESLRIMEPMGSFTTEYSSSNKRHLILFAGGSGITPMMSIMKSLLTQESDSVVSLVYANRNLDSIIFKSQFDEMKAQYNGRANIIHILDESPSDWTGYSGLLNGEMLVKIFDSIPDMGLENTTYFMCGPEGMMKNVEELLEKHNIPADKVFKESFTASTDDKPDEASGEIITREVRVAYDGEEHVFTVEPDSSILESALDQGIDLPYSCQSGLCTACRGKCVSGKVKMDEDDGLSEDELAEGYVLTCVGHPLTDNVTIEIG